ncbi:hypothetical protein COLO4_19266 [Corchorus olitorius]|uniref:F-box associated domain-containing protein n=1 Tax=Corchorus olitorius TaxID=93759 RepID=A0A1R3J662_9ROSI|nr:hypothetical protein COLO4_19266 [Corchorus olitorius]
MENVNGTYYDYYRQVLDVNVLVGLIFSLTHGDEKYIDLWVLDDGRWTRKLKTGSILDVDRLLCFAGKGIGNGKLFFVSRDGELVFGTTTRQLKKLSFFSAHAETMQLV